MSDYDRRVYRRGQGRAGYSWEDYGLIKVDVQGSTEIDKGDFLFLDKVDNLRGGGDSTANWTVYPFSDLYGTTRTLASNRTLAATYFVGVAGWHSDSGVTEKVSVMTAGLFNYPLKSTRHTKLTMYVMPAGSGTTLYSQKVAVSSTSGGYVGLVCDSGDFRSSVDVQICSLLHYFNPAW
jgi:hypothetical protein